jgi:hypothetical protein
VALEITTVKFKATLQLEIDIRIVILLIALFS